MVKVLRIPEDAVSVVRSFFDLGGHSLTAAKLVSRMRARLAIDVPIAVLFQTPSVRGLAGSYGDGAKAAAQEDKGARKEEVEEGGIPAQRREMLDDVYLPPGFDVAGLAYPSHSSPLSKQTVLLTGATGFLGAYLVRSLLVCRD